MLAATVVISAFFIGRSVQQSNADPAAFLSSYDYIVCGGGTAGLTVATRLSESPDVTVLVVEAGTASGSGEWGLPQTPAEFGAGTPPNVRAGKGLGGSSLINGRVYLRAEATQINDWERVGNPGWNWDSLFKYYRKSETISPPDERQAAAGMAYDAAFHGTDGPVTTGFPGNPASVDYLNRLKQAYPVLDIPVVKDVNGGKMHGFATYPRTQQTINNVDIQESSRTAYYEPLIASRPNLDVLTEATVRRIIWATKNATTTRENTTNSEETSATGGGIRATGVEVSGSSDRTFTAKREVILTAGAYRSPGILEYSGVGNPAILTPLGINVTIALPGVGEHLMDQTNNILEFANAPNSTLTRNDTAYVAFITATDMWGAAGAAKQAHEVRAALPGYARAIAARNNNATSEADLMKLLTMQYEQIFARNITVVELLHGLSLRDDLLQCEFWAVQPFTRGNVHITSAEAPKGTGDAKIAIKNNFWMTDWDLKSQIGAAKTIRRLYDTPALKGTVVGAEISPGLQTVPANATDDEWEIYLKSKFRSAWHPVGSTAMLPKPMGGVVDANLLVYGTANVRVADASVLPFQVNGHTSATVYAVAEKAADIIKASSVLISN